MSDKEIIYYRESLFQSIISDIISTSFIATLFLFNHFMLDDSKVAGFFFFMVFILFVISKASSNKMVFTSKDALIAYLIDKRK